MPMVGPMVGDLEGLRQMAMPIDINTIGIPSEIRILPPPDIMVLHDIPSTISLVAPNLKDIRILGPDKPLPTEIKLVNFDIPRVIELIAPSLPRSITLDATSLPRAISLHVPADFPSRIVLDGTSIPDKIQVVGIPSAIELIHNLPETIQLLMPENPVIQMKYSGDPIEVKIQLDATKLAGDGDEGPCFTLVPCKR